MSARRAPAGFEEVVGATAPDLLAYLERRVDEREVAADLLAEVLLVAWRRARAVPADPERARMWLFGVARNVLANHRRGLRRRWSTAERLRAEVARATRLAAGEDAAGDRVRDALDALPDDLRELVRLVHWDGFGIAEAGELMGIGASTARGRYARARELLAAALSSTSVPANHGSPCSTGPARAISARTGSSGG